MNYYKILIVQYIPYPDNEIIYCSPKRLEIGTIVKVSIGAQTKEKIGIITEIIDGKYIDFTVFEINEIITSQPISQNNIIFIKKFAKYNNIKQNVATKMMLPVIPLAINNEKIFIQNNLQKKELTLSIEQTEALEQLKKNEEKYSATLLFGTVGSGKTALYIKYAEHIINQQQEAQILILVPEITLINEVAEKIKEIMEVTPITWCSITKNKSNILYKIINGECKVLIGTRSALMLPYKNLKLIIIDEEHDASYRQDSKAQYNARDMAILKAHIHDINILLCSATPSIETFYNASINKYKTIQIKKKFNSATTKITTIENKNNKGQLLAEETKEHIIKTLSKNEQVLILLNKRGFSTMAICKKCSFVFHCKHCSVAMTVHKQENKHTMQCHQCGSTKNENCEDIKNINCEQCNSKGSITTYGKRIQQLKEEVESFIKDKKITLITSDNTNNELDKINAIKEIQNNKAHIIIGTQMIAKGHNFISLSLVVIVDSDIKSFCPDFRINERTYQLIHQAIGRTGRFFKNGHAIIQTNLPENELIKIIKNFNYEEFYQYEISYRKKYSMPPFTKCITIIARHTENYVAQKTSNIILNNIQLMPLKDILIVGPQKAPIHQIKNFYRHQIIIFTKEYKNIKQIIFTINALIEKNKKSLSEILLEIDPINFY